jgi:toxin HigB-1
VLLEVQLRYQFTDPNLTELYEYGNKSKLASQIGPNLVKAFIKVVLFIEKAADERDLIMMRGLRYHALEGTRKDQHSLSLNDQWRLIVQWTKDDDGNLLLLIEIVDYH